MGKVDSVLSYVNANVLTGVFDKGDVILATITLF